MRKIKALTFDVYGTLIDTADSSIQATREILARGGIHLSPRLFYQKWRQAADKLRSGDIFYNVKQILSKSFQKTLQDFGLVPSLDHIDIMFEAIKNRRVFPEVKDVCLKLSQNYIIAILSNADDELVLPSIERTGLSFTYVVTSESAKAYKPDPKIFRDCLERLGCSAPEVLHIGNSRLEDITGAKNVGMPVVWVNRDHEVIQDRSIKPDYEIKDLRGLLDILL